MAHSAGKVLLSAVLLLLVAIDAAAGGMYKLHTCMLQAATDQCHLKLIFKLLAKS
jgi:hypothetical protein